MTGPPCEQLDDYLLGELAGAEREAFERHCAVCEPCRSAVRRQSRWDGLLKAAAESVGCPPGLIRRVQSELACARQQSRRRRAIAALIAACVVIGLGGWLMIDRGRPPDRQPGNDVTKVQDKKPVHQPAAANPPRVRVELPRSVIAVHIDSGDPDVTLIQVYPVVETSATRLGNSPRSQE